MKKGIILSLLAVVLVGITIFAVWYINEQGKMHTGGKDSFIPYNSALVVHINTNVKLSPEIQQAFSSDMDRFNSRLLSRAADTLKKQGYVSEAPYTLAIRVEGKANVSFLYIMDNKDVLSRGEIAGFLQQAFPGNDGKGRKYDQHKIYSLKEGKEEMYFSVCGGIILLSNSELYIEDGLKQFDQEEEGEQAGKNRFENLDKYFSVGAGINVFMNTELFSSLLPLYINPQSVFPDIDISHLFKWGALDGELGSQGICLNGFLQYTGEESSLIKTLEKQNPLEATIDGIVPSRLISFGVLNLSSPGIYFSALDALRYSIGQKEEVFRRKKQLAEMFGEGVEDELRNLLQGEFALVNMAYDETNGECDGIAVAGLKSGSLCRSLVERMLKDYAYSNKIEMASLKRTYHIDREKSFTYYSFPATDLTSVYWGYWFAGIKNRYVLVEDNYLVFASSENAIRNFVKDYVRGSSIRDVEWYRDMKARLSGKYNLAYFAEVAPMLPYYASLATGAWQSWLKTNSGSIGVFPVLALQWSNEGNILYNTLFLSTARIENEVRPHILWQTKLDAPLSAKPVPVQNHVTGEKEIFVQDDNHMIYLINDAGRVLWKQPVEGRINSEVYQVDFFKNGKLQYLFSTPSRMYLIDRNGDAVGRFPVVFRTSCTQGITVFDYDGDKDFRIFAPCDDQQVYLYGLDGNLVKGWNTWKADKPIVSKVQHFRIGNKDYIVFADRYRLYILDRKGSERVNIGAVFDLREHTDIYLIRKGGVPMLAFANVEGPVNIVGFNGELQTMRCGTLSAGYNMNVADVDGNGVADFVFTDNERLSVYSMSGQLMYEKALDAHSLDFPYIYRFSATDMRIGLLDKEQSRMLLLTPDGTVTQGFPITGDSPFSIVFSGNDGFFLFAGMDNGTMIKYRVQR